MSLAAAIAAGLGAASRRPIRRWLPTLGRNPDQTPAAPASAWPVRTGSTLAVTVGEGRATPQRTMIGWFGICGVRGISAQPMLQRYIGWRARARARARRGVTAKRP